MLLVAGCDVLAGEVQRALPALTSVDGFCSTAWGRFLSHKFFGILEFRWICACWEFVLEKSERTLRCCFFGSESSRFFRSTLGATSSSWRLVLWRNDMTKHHRNSQGFRWGHPPNFLNTPQKVLNLRSWSWGKFLWTNWTQNTDSNFGSQTKILQEKTYLHISFTKKQQ